MFYLHQAVCISPQKTFISFDPNLLEEPVGIKLEVIEPSYEGVPRNLLRRMGKAVRIGVGACMPILRSAPGPVAGIIIGTANGGTEDSFRFLEQIIEFDDGVLTPGNFVQSTSNAMASQLSMLDGNKGYNLTHVHRGLAFENAVLDAALLTGEDEQAWYVLAGVDEISSSNFTLDSLEGWYKKEHAAPGHFYDADSPGTIAGEGAAAFSVSRQRQNAIARVDALATLHSHEPALVRQRLDRFLKDHLPDGTAIDLLLSGENGDCRLQKYYEACEGGLSAGVSIARFKHLCGEYPTASSFALWLACQLLSGAALPGPMLKQGDPHQPFRKILIYNHYKGAQHSFMLVSAVDR